MDSYVAPYFSVIIPVYNKGSHLSNALDSLYSQRFRNFEIIAVDDGSTDGSLDILNRHREKGLIRLYHRDKPGPGGYAARNHGASHAKAEWLVFLDADDWCSEDHLAEFYDNIENNKDQNIGLYVNAYSKIINGDEVSCIARSYDGVLTRERGLELFSRSDYIHMNGACINRNMFMSSGGFPEGRYRRGGDVYFWIKVLASLPNSHYNQKITSYWVIDNSGVSNNLNNLEHIHPARDVLPIHSARLSRKEVYYLKKAINRKVVSWAVEKKHNGMLFREDVMSIYPMALSFKQSVHFLMLFLPRDFFFKCRAMMKQVH